MYIKSISRTSSAVNTTPLRGIKKVQGSRFKGSGFRVEDQKAKTKRILSTDYQDYQDYEMQEYWNDGISSFAEAMEDKME
jgi:hypothetical protein